MPRGRPSSRVVVVPIRIGMSHADLLRRASAFVVVLALLVAPVGCAEIQDLLKLREALAERYGDVYVNINAENGRRILELTVDPDVLKRPSLPGLVARDIARFARDHYSRPVDEWIVVFGTKREVGAFHFENSLGEYAFAGADL